MTPTYQRHPANMETIKLAKQFEMYTIKKVNSKSFTGENRKKKNRIPIGKEIIKLSIDCFTFLVKSHYTKDKNKALELAEKSFSSLYALSAQLDTANNIYEKTPIEGIEYWSGLIVDLEESIKFWMENIEKQ